MQTEQKQDEQKNGRYVTSKSGKKYGPYNRTDGRRASGILSDEYIGALIKFKRKSGLNESQTVNKALEMLFKSEGLIK